MESWNERCQHNRGLMACNLPDETYGQIFGYGCAETLHMVFLSHVCRRWRAACFETPSLWAHLDIILPFQRVGHSFTEICVRLERIRSETTPHPMQAYRRFSDGFQPASGLLPVTQRNDYSTGDKYQSG